MATPVTGSRFEPLGGRLVVVLLGAMALLTGAAALAYARRSRLIDDVLAGADVSTATFDAASDRVQLVGNLFPLGLLVTGIAFVAWERRYLRNADRLAGPGSVRPGLGWVVPLWLGLGLVPAVPAYQVYRIAAAGEAAAPEPAGEDDADGGDGDGDAPAVRPRSRRPPGIGILVAWATTWTVGFAITFVAALLWPGGGAPTADHADADRVAAVGVAVECVAALCGAAMVRALGRRQTELMAVATPIPIPADEAPGPAPGPRPGLRPRRPGPARRG